MTTETMHPFERSGLGIGPYKLLYVASIPSPSLAGSNPDAYNNALRMLPRDVPLGTCNHCGMVIMHNYVCKSADGHKFAVGSECVFKVADKSLGDAVKVEKARIEREARRAKKDAAREARRAQWLIDNAERLAAEKAAREAQEIEAAKARAAVTEKWSFLIPVLEKQTGNFCAAIVEAIRNGRAPQGRAVQILREIYAKAHGRKGSKAYEAAYAECEAKTQEENAE